MVCDMWPEASVRMASVSVMNTEMSVKMAVRRQQRDIETAVLKISLHLLKDMKTEVMSCKWGR